MPYQYLHSAEQSEVGQEPKREGAKERLIGGGSFRIRVLVVVVRKDSSFGGVSRSVSQSVIQSVSQTVSQTDKHTHTHTERE